jgi:transcriptional regulator with XRE-family HTH domain
MTMGKISETGVSALINSRINDSEKTQREIAMECGWNPNVISMVKSGEMRLPLDKVGPLAKAIGINPGILFWMVMKEYAPEALEAIETEVTGLVVHPHELAVLAAYRKLAGGTDIAKEAVVSVGGRSIRVEVEKALTRKPDF